MDLRQVFVTSKKEEKSETGVKIKKIRLMRGVKVTKIAGMMGVNEACVRNYEIAYRNPDRESLGKIVSFPYECENEKIMGRTLNDVSLRMFDDTLEKWQEFIKDKEYGVLLLDEALREYMRNKERRE